MPMEYFERSLETICLRPGYWTTTNKEVAQQLLPQAHRPRWQARQMRPGVLSEIHLSDQALNEDNEEDVGFGLDLDDDSGSESDRSLQPPRDPRSNNGSIRV